MTNKDGRAAVLYVDDEAPNRTAFQFTFDDRFTIRCADGATEALQILETETVGIIVCDQRMPSMSGNELLAQVRERWPEIPRIIVTGYSDLDLILGAVNQGLVARYIVKPWDEEEMARILAWGLNTYELGETMGYSIQLRLLETERLATLGAMQASFSHEIGQPLSFISGNLELVEELAEHAEDLARLVQQSRRFDRDDRKRLHELLTDLPNVLADMRAGCDLLVALRAGVQDLVRAERTGEPFQGGADVARSIEFAIRVNEAAASRAHTRMHFVSPRSLPRVRLGPAELIQIMVNLLHNAIHSHSASGGVIRIVTEERDDELVISVSDQGAGMPKEILDRIGTPFFSTRKEGTGLGVHKCKALLERVGGRLEYESEPNVGTTAHAIIPRTQGLAHGW